MKKKIKILIMLLFILIILFIKMFFAKESSEIQKNDDFLFLKLFSNGNSNNNSTMLTKQEYKFKVDYKNIDLKTIDLAKTMNRETLIYEKIAPGTKGCFDILLDSNQNLKYKIEFDSVNEKPKNLNFKAFNNERLIGEANTLEELSENLSGYIKKNEKINITICWYWNFESENDKEADIQDTKDAENIRKYQFYVSALGEEIV